MGPSLRYCAWQDEAAERPSAWSTGWTEVASDVVATPGFARTAGEPSTWDLHLLATSPLVDAGDPTLLDADGTRSDIGAYGGPGGADW